MTNTHYSTENASNASSRYSDEGAKNKGNTYISTGGVEIRNEKGTSVDSLNYNYGDENTNSNFYHNLINYADRGEGKDAVDDYVYNGSKPYCTSYNNDTTATNFDIWSQGSVSNQFNKKIMNDYEVEASQRKCNYYDDDVLNESTRGKNEYNKPKNAHESVNSGKSSRHCPTTSKNNLFNNETLNDNYNHTQESIYNHHDTYLYDLKETNFEPSVYMMESTNNEIIAPFYKPKKEIMMQTKTPYNEVNNNEFEPFKIDDKTYLQQIKNNSQHFNSKRNEKMSSELSLQASQNYQDFDDQQNITRRNFNSQYALDIDEKINTPAYSTNSYEAAGGKRRTRSRTNNHKYEYKTNYYQNDNGYSSGLNDESVYLQRPVIDMKLYPQSHTIQKEQFNGKNNIYYNKKEMVNSIDNINDLERFYQGENSMCSNNKKEYRNSNNKTLYSLENQDQIKLRFYVNPDHLKNQRYNENLKNEQRNDNYRLTNQNKQIEAGNQKIINQDLLHNFVFNKQGIQTPQQYLFSENNEYDTKYSSDNFFYKGTTMSINEDENEAFEYIYSCNPCMKKFKRLSTLKIHIFSHFKGAFIYACTKPSCCVGFKSQSIALKHIEHYHSDESKILSENLKRSKYLSVFRSFTTLIDYYKLYCPDVDNPFMGNFCFGCFTYPRSIAEHPCTKMFYSLTVCPSCKADVKYGELKEHVLTDKCERAAPCLKDSDLKALRQDDIKM